MVRPTLALLVLAVMVGLSLAAENASTPAPSSAFIQLSNSTNATAPSNGSERHGRMFGKEDKKGEGQGYGGGYGGGYPPMGGMGYGYGFPPPYYGYNPYYGYPYYG